MYTQIITLTTKIPPVYFTNAVDNTSKSRRKHHGSLCPSAASCLKKHYGMLCQCISFGAPVLFMVSLKLVLCSWKWTHHGNCTLRIPFHFCNEIFCLRLFHHAQHSVLDTTFLCGGVFSAASQMERAFQQLAAWPVPCCCFFGTFSNDSKPGMYYQ